MSPDDNKKFNKQLREFFKDEDAGGNLVRQVLQIAAVSSDSIKSPKLKTAVSAASIAMSLGSLGTQLYTGIKNIRSNTAPRFSATVGEGAAYDVLMDLLLKDMEEDEIETIGVSVTWSGNAYSRRRTPTVVYSFDEDLDAVLKIKDYSVRIRTLSNRSVQQQQGQNDAVQGPATQRNSKPALEMIFDDAEARTVVLAELERLVGESNKPAPSFYVNGKWSGFERVSEIPTRPKESVILKEGQMDRILDHLRSFLTQEEHYVRLGIPYRTGVLFSGNPGSGKTSTASAIAFELGLDVYFVSLSSIASDNDLVSLMEDVPARAILILEDVDVAKATKERDDKGSGGVTMSGLLNSLDGFTSPHGVITLMTTNHRDSMDPAIIRPGRVDLEENINELDDYQLRGICEHFMGFVPENLPTISPETGITSASIVDILKKHIPNVEDAAGDLVRFVEEKATLFTK